MEEWENLISHNRAVNNLDVNVLANLLTGKLMSNKENISVANNILAIYELALVFADMAKKNIGSKITMLDEPHKNKDEKVNLLKTTINIWKSYILISLGIKYNEVLEFANSVIKNKSDLYKQVYTFRAMVYIRQRKWKQAVSDLEENIKLDGRDPMAQELLKYAKEQLK